MLLCAVLSVVAPKPSEDFLFATHKCVVKYCIGGLMGGCAWIAVAYHLCSAVWNFTWVPLKLASKLVARSAQLFPAVFSRIGSVVTWVLVCVGAAEMSAASTAANWYRSQSAKLHLNYKYVRRIRRRTGGNFGAFVWQLLHGIEAAPGGSSIKVARSGKGGKNGSKAAASRRASKPVSSSNSARLQDAASGEPLMSPASSVNTGYSTSSSSDDEEDASLAELLTWLPAAAAKGNSNSKKSQSKVTAVPQGKQQSGRAAATTTAAPRTKQPAAAAAAAKASPASSSSNTGRPAAISTGKDAAAVSRKVTAEGMAGGVCAAVFLQDVCFSCKFACPASLCNAPEQRCKMYCLLDEAGRTYNCVALYSMRCFAYYAEAGSTCL
jgi:hypothetical protein